MNHMVQVFILEVIIDAMPAPMPVNVVSGIITVGSGISAVASGLNVNVGNFPSTSISGQTVNVGNFPTTSISGNVIDISGQSVQTSVSGNILQASISGDILVTSFSGNVITTVNQSPPTPSTNYVFVNTGFVVPENISGGVDLPDIGTFNSGLPIALIGYPGMNVPGLYAYYGVSGYLYSGPQNGSGAMVFILAVGNMPMQPWSDTWIGTPFPPLWPFTNTSQIKIITNASGMTLVYGGFI